MAALTGRTAAVAWYGERQERAVRVDRQQGRLPDLHGMCKCDPARRWKRTFCQNHDAQPRPNWRNFNQRFAGDHGQHLHSLLRSCRPAPIRPSISASMISCSIAAAMLRRRSLRSCLPRNSARSMFILVIGALCEPWLYSPVLLRSFTSASCACTRWWRSWSRRMCWRSWGQRKPRRLRIPFNDLRAARRALCATAPIQQVKAKGN